MPYARPTLTTLRQQAIQDILSRKPGAQVIIPNSNLDILAWVLSSAHTDQYGYIDYIAQQAVPYTATDEYLQAWAALRGIDRIPAAFTAGTITITGTIATLIPAGTPLRRSDGEVYHTSADATLDSTGAAIVPVIASVAEASGNSPAGTVLTLANGLAGVTSQCVASTLTGGADVETDDSLRSRMLLRYKQPPQGGSLTDYVEWAFASSANITRAWAQGNLMGPGTVTVWPMLDVVNSANQGFPIGSDGVSQYEQRAAAATGDLLAVADYIQELRPVTALVYVVSPTPYRVAIQINNLANSTAAMRAQISVALADVFTSSADPLGGTLYQSQIEDAISSVPGVSTFVLASPSATITAPIGSLPVLGTVNYA